MKNLLILTGLAAIGYIVWSQLHKGSEKDANGTISPADSLISDMKPYQNEQAAPGKPGLFPDEISKQFDTSVDEKSHQVWSRTKQTSWRRTRSGGTDFNCIPDFVSRPEFKNKWSGVVILTDGYADTLRATPGLKIMWLLTPHSTTACARPGDFLLKMKEEKVAKKI